MPTLAQVGFFLGHWTWFVLGAVLLGLELFAPGSVFLWFGIAAFGVGLLGLAFELGWQMEMLSFAILSLVTLAIWWRWFRVTAEETDQPFLNARAEGLVGRRFVLDTPIARGEGKVKVLDSVWRVRGPDLPAGTSVVVERVDGASLVVRPA